jgi:hypothetical protein
MTFFLLPHTVSNSVYDTDMIDNHTSLHEYINTFPQEDKLMHFGSYQPKTTRFFIMAELLQLHKIKVTTSLHNGTRSCIEYLQFIGNHQGVCIDNASGKYSLLVDDTDTPSLSFLQYQEEKGNYITKLIDSTCSQSMQFLYKLCSSYKIVYLCKPESECPTTSTKYVIALDFIKEPEQGNLKIPYYFKMKLDDMNSVFGQTQLEYLMSIEMTGQKKVEWCLKYSIPI